MELRLLKEGEEGYGLLVEKDSGHISPQSVENRKIIKEMNEVGSSYGPIQMVAVLDETWWDGNTLMGKLTLITSPAYESNGTATTPGDLAANLLRHGVQLGISSRGVGSLSNVGGQNMVQDDFELICFDLVSSPSTPGAYLFNQVEEAKPYVESKEPQKIMESKLDETIKNFLKD